MTTTNEKTTHTPGPYHVNAIKGGRVYGDETTPNAEKYQLCNANATIATVYRPKDCPILKAAPDMLAACKAAERLIGCTDDNDLCGLRAAIAKAEGH